MRKFAVAFIVTLAAVSGQAGAQSSEDGAESPDALQRALEPLAASQEAGPLSGLTNAHVTLAVTPVYPKRALKKNIDGEVTLEFEISKYGRAENVSVVSEEPQGFFADDAVEAMGYWAFSPARLATCGTVAQRARQTLWFKHDGRPQIEIAPLVVNDVPQAPQAMKETTLERFRQEQAAARQASQSYDPRRFLVTKRVEPEYPMKALERRKEGIVALAFVIEADGRVGDVEVVDTVAGTYFQRVSLSAIRQWTFQPTIRNGRAVASVACHEFVFHADEYERSGQLSRQREDANIRSYSLD